MPQTKEFWFSARTQRNQELRVRDSLKKLNVEHFVPTRVVVRQLKYRKKKAEIPVIRNLVFIRASKEKACAIPNDHGVQLFYMIDRQTRSFLVVPDKQMQDFMLVMDMDPDGVCFDNESIGIGEKVEVIKGVFSGVEGELVSMTNRSYVVIRVGQILSVSVSIPKSYLKKVAVK